MNSPLILGLFLVHTLHKLARANGARKKAQNKNITIKREYTRIFIYISTNVHMWIRYNMFVYICTFGEVWLLHHRVKKMSKDA